MRRRAVVVVVVVVVALGVALGAGGCRSCVDRIGAWRAGTATSAAAETRTPESLARALTGRFDERTSTAAAVGALARSGVEVYDDTSFALVQQPSGRRALLRYTRFQARNMALEVATRGGRRGAQLDALSAPITFAGARVPVTTSGLVAGWALSSRSPGATLARRLLGNVNPQATKAVRFPTLVLALFLADAAPALTKSASASPPGALDRALAEAGYLFGVPRPALAKSGPCGVAQELLKKLDDLLVSIQNSPDTGLLGWIGGALARAGVRVAMTAIRAKLASLRAMLETVAAATYSASLLMDWGLDVKADPPSLHHVPGSPTQGRFVATVTGADGIDYPDWLKECATLFQLTLPNVQSPEGMAISWAPGAGFTEHAHPVPTADLKVQADKTARYPIATAEEDPQAHTSGTEDRRPAEVTATVKRTFDPQQLARFVSGVTGVSRTTTSRIANLAGSAVNFVDVIGSGTAQVGFHVSPASFRKVIRGQGTIIVDGHNCAGLYGTWTVTIDIKPGGKQHSSFTVSKDNPTGSFNWTIPIPGASVHTGTMSATVSESKVTFSGGNRVITPFGAAGRADAGSAPITRGPTPACRTASTR